MPTPVMTWKQLFLLWIAFFCVIACVHFFDVDLLVADKIYSLNQHQWLWRDNFYTTVVVHHWGKDLSISMAVATLGALLYCQFSSQYKSYSRPLTYLIISVAVSTLMVSILKQLTSVDCPWSISRYGGNLPYVTIWQQAPENMPPSACFPAGHASAGYAWFALYYFFCYIKPKWRWAGLFTGLGLGLVFGVSQQLRGAHFLSHDLWTLMISWTVTVVCARIFLINTQIPRQIPVPAVSKAAL